MATLSTCQDCIWWMGNATGMEGECTHESGTMITITGRYTTECISFLDRELGDYVHHDKDALDDFS